MQSKLVKSTDLDFKIKEAAVLVTYRYPCDRIKLVVCALFLASIKGK